MPTSTALSCGWGLGLVRELGGIFTALSVVLGGSLSSKATDFFGYPLCGGSGSN